MGDSTTSDIPREVLASEDRWDEPESELTRELQSTLKKSPERFAMPDKLKRIQARALRNGGNG